MPWMIAITTINCTNDGRRSYAAAMITALVLSLGMLIPREVLFGEPERSRPAISPDGAKLAWIAPDERKVGNIWVQSVGRNDAKPVTHEKRGLYFFTWAPDGRHLLFFQDGDGDENDHLFSAALD